MEMKNATENLHIRITKKEKKQAIKKAEAKGLTVSSWIRMLIKTSK